MKKLTLLLILTLASDSMTFGATEYDMQAGIDPTARTSISGALLKQLVDLATPGTNKGLVIVQSTTPDTASNPRYTNFLWLDTTTRTLKSYNGSAWAATVFGTNSVGTDSITNGAVTGVKIASRTIDATNIALGTITRNELYPSTIDITKMDSASVGRNQLVAGSVNGTVLTNGAVLEANIADANVTSNKVANSAISTTQLANSGVTLPKLNAKQFTYGYFASDGSVIQASGLTAAHPSTGTYTISFTEGRAGANYLPLITQQFIGTAGVGWVTNCLSTAFTVRFAEGASGKDTPFYVLVIDPQ